MSALADVDAATTTGAQMGDSTKARAMGRGKTVRSDKLNGTSDSNPNSSSKARDRNDPPYLHVFPTHAQKRPSCLSQDAEGTPSFVGFRNLLILVVVFSNLRLMIENFRKYGVLICLSCHRISTRDIHNGIYLYLLVPLQLFIAFGIEHLAAHCAQAAASRLKHTKDGKPPTPSQERQAVRAFKATWYLIALAHALNATFFLVYTSTVVFHDIYHPGIGTFTELHAVIVWLKTASYAFTNRDLRYAYLHPTSAGAKALPELYASCSYPQNINLRNLCYFWWTPTLVYQPVYPRTPRIRRRYLLRCILEFISLSIITYLATAQYATPLLQNSLSSLSTLSIVGILERTLKLSTISLFIWLCGFYALFQSGLNGLAELLCFGDREFYAEWWNSDSIRTYWTSWNKPVTNYMRRHLYSPLVARGWPKWAAQSLVFLFSAILHELLVGVPTHSLVGIAAGGMMFQIPLMILGDWMKR